MTLRPAKKGPMTMILANQTAALPKIVLKKPSGLGGETSNQRINTWVVRSAMNNYSDERNASVISTCNFSKLG